MPSQEGEVMSTEEIKAIELVIRSVENEIANLEAKRRHHAEKLRAIKSLQWIRANEVTRDNIQFSSGVGIPFFMMFADFAYWMRNNNNDKRFCEWNQAIYFRAEVIDGILKSRTVGNIKDLPVLEKAS
jgi:hypothetical protein